MTGGVTCAARDRGYLPAKEGPPRPGMLPISPLQARICWLICSPSGDAGAVVFRVFSAYPATITRHSPGVAPTLSAMQWHSCMVRGLRLCALAAACMHPFCICSVNITGGKSWGTSASAAPAAHPLLVVGHGMPGWLSGVFMPAAFAAVKSNGMMAMAASSGVCIRFCMLIFFLMSTDKIVSS